MKMIPNEFGFEWAKDTPLGLKGNLDHSDNPNTIETEQNETKPESIKPTT